MSEQEKRVAYPLIAGMCALVLVGGPIAFILVKSAKHAGQPSRHVAVAQREPEAVPYTFRPVKNENHPASPIESRKTEKDMDREEVRPKEPVRESEEPKEDREPAKEIPPEAKPVQPPAGPDGVKSADRTDSPSPTSLSPEEKMVQIIRAFIVRQLARPDGFDIVDHTKPQRVKAVNKKPAQLMRVVFRAQDGSGRLGGHDFLFVVQKDEVVEHAPTAVYVAAQRARQQAMLQVALLNEAVLQQQLQSAGAASSGGGGRGGCILTGG